MSNFCKLEQVQDVYIDGLLCHKDQLLFLSCWATDTRMQELLAALTIKQSDGGLLNSNLSISRPDGTVVQAWVGEKSKLRKRQGRMVPSSLFGERLVHVMLFVPFLGGIDKANRRALVVGTKGTGLTDPDRLWPVVKEVVPVPMLDAWKEPVISALWAENWLKAIPGLKIDAVDLDVGDVPIEDWIGNKIRRGDLPVELTA